MHVHVFSCAYIAFAYYSVCVHIFNETSETQERLERKMRLWFKDFLDVLHVHVHYYQREVVWELMVG